MDPFDLEGMYGFLVFVSWLEQSASQTTMILLPQTRHEGTLTRNSRKSPDLEVGVRSENVRIARHGIRHRRATSRNLEQAGEL